MRDPRVSLAIATDYPQPLQIKGLSIAARAAEVSDQASATTPPNCCCKRYPEYKVMPRLDPAAVPTLRLTPEIVSVLDYSKGFGHTDLVRVTDNDLAEFVEARRHHGRVSTRPERGCQVARAPACTGVPRRNSSAAHRLLAGALHLREPHRALAAGHGEARRRARCRARRTLALGRAQGLDARAGELEPGAGKRRQPADVVVHLLPRLLQSMRVSSLAILAA